MATYTWGTNTGYWSVAAKGVAIQSDRETMIAAGGTKPRTIRKRPIRRSRR
jgi:hypothetical protein